MFKKITLFCVIPVSLLLTAQAQTFELASTDISHGKQMSNAQEFNGFGCNGKDISPQLSWSGAPEGTKSFALTVYDPDAPTGSGWWHWQLINIPKEVRELPQEAGNVSKAIAPKESLQMKNDYSQLGFGGACPPKGHGVHHYQFTIHALSVEKITIAEGASAALVGYMINANSIESATIEALYSRK